MGSEGGLGMGGEVWVRRLGKGIMRFGYGRCCAGIEVRCEYGGLWEIIRYPSSLGGVKKG